MEATEVNGAMKRILLLPGEKHLSRKVIEHYGSCIAPTTHTLSVVSCNEDGFSVTPYEKETPNTVYHDKPLHIFHAQGMLYEEQ